MKLKIPTFVFLLRAMSSSPLSDLKHKTGRPGIERGSPEFWYHLIVGMFLVLAGGVFAGYVCRNTCCNIFSWYLVSLTLGLMGLDELHLRVLATSSEDLTQKRNAQKGLDEIFSFSIYSHWSFFETVLKLMQKGRHWVLVVRLWP